MIGTYYALDFYNSSQNCKIYKGYKVEIIKEYPKSYKIKFKNFGPNNCPPGSTKVVYKKNVIIQTPS